MLKVSKRAKKIEQSIVHNNIVFIPQIIPTIRLKQIIKKPHISKQKSPIKYKNQHLLINFRKQPTHYKKKPLKTSKITH